MTDHTTRGGPPPRPDDADEPLEPWLRALAADYHRPPATPRDAMWARIQAARGAPAPGASTAPPTPATAGGGPAAGRPPQPLAVAMTADEVAGARARRGRGATGEHAWVRPLLALAATLLVGVGVGRWTTARDGAPADGPSRAVAAAPETAGRPARADAGPPPTSIMPSGAAAGITDPPPPAPIGRATPDAPAGGPPPASSRRAAGVRRATVPFPTAAPSPAAPRLAAADPVTDPAAGPGVGRPTTAGRDGLAAPMRVATVQHLGQVEALLAAFRAEPPRGGAAPALQPWAGELLVTTRLLLDSPAAADPRLGPLLGELETVLVQIVQLPAARHPGERQIIAQSLDDSDLMTQLRAAVPAGPAGPQRSGE